MAKPSKKKTDAAFKAPVINPETVILSHTVLCAGKNTKDAFKKAGTKENSLLLSHVRSAMIDETTSDYERGMKSGKAE